MPDPRTAEERLRAAAETMLRHHDDLVSVPSGEPLNCDEAMALRAALAVEPVPAPLDVVLDRTYDKAKATYDLPGQCHICGTRFTVRREKGMDPPLHVECPSCECTVFGWRLGATPPEPKP